jgi:hypothetical protein
MEIRELRYFTAVYAERNLTALLHFAALDLGGDRQSRGGAGYDAVHPAQEGGRADGVGGAVSCLRSAHH